MGDVPAGVFNRVQVLVGLVAAGAGVAVVVSSAGDKAPPVVGHPFIPTLHVVADDLPEAEMKTGKAVRQSADLVLHGLPGEDAGARNFRWLREVVKLLAAAASR